MALWYHFDLFSGFEFSGHIDIKLDDSQIQPLRDSFSKFGIDVIFNEKFNPWTIKEANRLCPSELETIIQET